MATLKKLQLGDFQDICKSVLKAVMLNRFLKKSAVHVFLFIFCVKYIILAMLLFLGCRGSSQPRNVNVVTVYDIQNKFIGKG